MSHPDKRIYPSQSASQYPDEDGDEEQAQHGLEHADSDVRNFGRSLSQQPHVASPDSTMMPRTLSIPASPRQQSRSHSRFHSTPHFDKGVLPHLHFTYSKTKLGLYILFLMFCNLGIPCVIFYPIRILAHKINLQTNIGIASASLGLSSCFDAPFRLYKLTRYRKLYGPLHDHVWWHGDFFMWTYTFALFCFAFPLAIAPALTPVAIDFFLMSTSMLVLPFGIVLLFTLFIHHLWPSFETRWNPFWFSSDAPGTKLKPGAFYILEDVAAVDFREGKWYRETLHARYACSPPFRSLIYIQTVYWTIATFLYIGVTAAVTWATPLNFAFAFVLGQMFIWLFAAGAGSWLLARRGLRHERVWWEGQYGVTKRGTVDLPSGANVAATIGRLPDGEIQAHRQSQNTDSGATAVEHADNEKREDGRDGGGTFKVAVSKVLRR